MTASDLLLAPAPREAVQAFFEPRAAAVDRGTATVAEGLAFIAARILPPAEPLAAAGPNADLSRVAETIATVAWSDMSSAFSLWCQRMVAEYTGLAPAASPVAALLPRLLRADLLGSTALAAAMAHAVSGAPLTVTGQRDGETIILTGRVNWASNLFPPDFLMVTAAAGLAGEPPCIVAIPGDAPGLRIMPYPSLMALDATGSSSLALEEVRLPAAWVVTSDFTGFIRRVRPTFLLLQSCFAWGLAARAVAEAGPALRGVSESLRPDLEELTAGVATVAQRVRQGIAERERTPIRDLVALRLDAARLATAAVALEAKAMGGRGYVVTCPTARRLREAAFLPVQAPTEGQLRWELSRSA